MSLFLANAWGWMLSHWRLVLTIAGLIVLLVAVAVVFKRCTRPKPIDEAKIQEAIRAIEEKNDAKLKEILVEADVKEQQIDANIAEGRKATVNAMANAREKYSNMNTDELAAELEKRK